MFGVRHIVSALVASAVGAQSALACAFHGYTPSPTLVDLLLDTEQAVIAVPEDKTAITFRTIDVLMGAPVQTVSVPSNPALRRDLARGGRDSYLLARDGAYGPWFALSPLDPQFRQVVEQVAARQSDWQRGADADRAQLFASLLDTSNPVLQRLALQEMDRLSYGDLKRLRPSAASVEMPDLDAGDEGLQPIRILLMGLSGDTRLIAPMQRDLAKAVARDVPYLGAYVTALVELQGAQGAQEIIATYLAPGTLPLQPAERVMQALSVQYKAAPAATRRAITRQIAQVVRDTPIFAPMAARHFGYGARRPATKESAAPSR